MLSVPVITSDDLRPQPDYRYVTIDSRGVDVPVRVGEIEEAYMVLLYGRPHIFCSPSVEVAMKRELTDG